MKVTCEVIKTNKVNFISKSMYYFEFLDDDLIQKKTKIFTDYEYEVINIIKQNFFNQKNHLIMNHRKNIV